MVPRARRQGVARFTSLVGCRCTGFIARNIYWNAGYPHDRGQRQTKRADGRNA
jgi:hypothetical protein